MDIEIDVNILEDSIKAYNKAISELEKVKIEIHKNIQLLDNEGFTGEAKEAFMDYLYADWTSGFNQHIEDIDQMKVILTKTLEKCNELVSKTQNLSRLLY